MVSPERSQLSKWEDLLRRFEIPEKIGMFWNVKRNISDDYDKMRIRLLDRYVCGNLLSFVGGLYERGILSCLIDAPDCDSVEKHHLKFGIECGWITQVKMTVFWHLALPLLLGV